MQMSGQMDGNVKGLRSVGIFEKHSQLRCSARQMLNDTSALMTQHVLSSHKVDVTIMWQSHTGILPITEIQQQQ